MGKFWTSSPSIYTQAYLSSSFHFYTHIHLTLCALNDFLKVLTGSQQWITNGLRTDVPKGLYAANLWMKEAANEKKLNLGFADQYPYFPSSISKRKNISPAFLRACLWHSLFSGSQ